MARAKMSDVNPLAAAKARLEAAEDAIRDASIVLVVEGDAALPDWAAAIVASPPASLKRVEVRRLSDAADLPLPGFDLAIVVACHDAVRAALEVAAALAARAAVLKLGAVEEALLRQDRITWTGRIRDTVLFSVLDSEWPGVRDGLDARLAAFAA